MKKQRAEIVKKALKERGMSKYMLRAKSSVGMSIINKIIKADGYHMKSFDKVAEVLGIEANYFLQDFPCLTEGDRCTKQCEACKSFENGIINEKY
jgi:hypothetical protein